MMKAEFFLLPAAAALVIAGPVRADVFLTVEQAQNLMFPAGAFTKDFRTLSDAQAATIEEASGTNVRGRALQAWRVSTGGWFIVDEVVGKHDFIPIALGLNADGSVKAVEILEYREAYGGEVRNPKWLAQFTGRKNGTGLQLGEGIQNISGATLSSKHITDGVRRLLATYAAVLANH
jgi:hypothetical protein